MLAKNDEEFLNDGQRAYPIEGRPDMTIVAATIATPLRAAAQALPLPPGGEAFGECLSRLPVAAGSPPDVRQGAVSIATGNVALLLDQAGPEERRRRDRAASERSGRLLSLLKRLQCYALRDGVETEQVLTELSSVLDASAETDDPELARIAAAIELRVRVELARRGPAREQGSGRR